jgi:hypothetical protein
MVVCHIDLPKGAWSDPPKELANWQTWALPASMEEEVKVVEAGHIG